MEGWFQNRESYVTVHNLAKIGFVHVVVVGLQITDPYEIQARLYDRSSGLAEKIGRDIGLYSVAILAVSGSGEAERLCFRGSGSLVSIGESSYILTAAHVWEYFEQNNPVGIGLTLDNEDVDHRFFMSVKSIVSYGPAKVGDWNPWGPDMRLLKMPDEFAVELKKVKRFYALTVEPPALPNVNSLELWILMGSPAAQGTFTDKHASLTMNAFFATIRCHQMHDDYDYVDLDMDVTFPGIPKRFGGVSGGGFWSVFIYGSDDGELHWIPTLVGMAFYQLDLVDNIRPVRCHGEKSIRTLISSVDR